MPRVSIVINCHNSDMYLRETLLSVAEQTFTDYEIVLWDNASTDQTSEVAREFGDKLKYFYSEDFVSLGEARNKALAKCSGEYITFLDSDDLWEKDKLAVQVQVMEEDLSIGLVMTNFNTLNMFNNKLSKENTVKDKVYDFESFITQYAYCLSTFMIRRSLLKEMDLWFDERFEYAEEYDFFSRLVYGSKAYYIGESLVIRRMHGGMSTISLAPRIPLEHQMTLDNLRLYIPEFDKKHPDVVRKIEYVRDYMDAKYKFPIAKNAEIRKLVRSYIFSEKRALVYYLMACLPKKLTLFIYNRIYHNSI